MRYGLILLALIWGVFTTPFAFASDDHDHSAEEDSHDHAHADGPTVGVTQWVGDYELFMEYPVLAVDLHGSFIIHLTDLRDFSPVLDGKILLDFKHETGKTYSFKSTHVARDGIFTPELALPYTGRYDFTLRYQKDGNETRFEIGEIIVYLNAEKFPESRETFEEGISFLKEQQWKIDFGTEVVSRKNLRPSVHSVGVVKPVQTSYVDIVAPVDGIISYSQNNQMVIPGSDVEKNQHLLTLTPPFDGSGSWTERNLAFEQAKNDFQRAERLITSGSISQREYEEFKNRYEVQKAGFEEYNSDSNSQLMTLNAPLKGKVVNVLVHPGQKVEAGQVLMTVVDLSNVWVQMQLFERDFYAMEKPVEATINITGREESIIVDKTQFRLLNSGQIFDPVSHTLPVLFSMPNADGILRLEQRIHVDLFGDSSIPFLSVDRNAVINDNGQDVVFVQVEGEFFEKRTVKTGITDNGNVAILGGISEGERVVTKGAYLVKLASITTEVGHGHTH